MQVAILCAVKAIAHWMGIEWLSANALFSALVASTVFLLGFLLNGVLTDFKESEKLPGEIATSLETLSLEVQAIPSYNADANIDRSLVAISSLAQDILSWIKEQQSTEQIYANYRLTHREVVAAAAQIKGDASTLRGRLMQELASILVRLNRIRTIRDTTFVPLVYWMADIASVLLFSGLVMMKTVNLLESVFFLGVISFLLILLLRLIDDIDNPFGYSDLNSAEDISIDLLEDVTIRLGDGLKAPPT
ncbi:MAG: bestrophin family ion channel [Synechococcus sp. ELA057]